MNARPVFEKLALIAIVLFTACSFSSTTDDHPRLIITRHNIDDYKSKSKGTHRQLYDLAIRKADEFSKREPPRPQNAANTYREIGETMPSLGLAYLLTGDKKYLSAAEKWINVLLDVPSWDGSQNLGRSAWVTGTGQLYDWLYDDLNKDLKERMLTRLKSEAEIIQKTAAKTRALSNHLLIETSALGTVGLILPGDDPMRDTFLKQATQWTEYIISNAPLDGSWGEGVQYWEYGLGYFLRFLEGASTAGYHDYFNSYDWLKKTGRFPLHFSVPDNLTRVINFGDCGSDRYIPAFLLYLPAGKYRDGVLQDYALKIQAAEPHKFSWLDFLTYDPSLEPVDYRTVENEFFHFEDNGYVTMRSSWKEDATLIGFRCGPAPGHANQAKPERMINEGYGPGHQHPDINTFVVYSNGTWLAIDPGYVYLKETRNYNTVLVNGKGQAGAGSQWLDYREFEKREPAPKITLAETTSDYDYVIGDAGNIYVDEAGLEFFERQIMFLKPDVIIIA
ncbi:MAG TPA: heparinase II/III family protein, partial [Bacteroidales bacterium]|nr:heparinase II/III family protein [Bacteroidales bacterium]